jgi:hypothetical protein
MRLLGVVVDCWLLGRWLDTGSLMLGFECLEESGMESRRERRRRAC